MRTRMAIGMIELVTKKISRTKNEVNEWNDKSKERR